MRWLAGICVSLMALGTAAAETDRLAGTWVGEKDGREVRWSFSDPGRLRANGRPGDYCLSHDTLTVRFDPPLGATTVDMGEKAIYGFVASVPRSGPARLFVYGFDLGKLGLWLEREEAPALPEDAAPPVPAQTKPTPAAARGATAIAGAADNR